MGGGGGGGHPAPPHPFILQNCVDCYNYSKLEVCDIRRLGTDQLW